MKSVEFREVAVDGNGWLCHEGGAPSKSLTTQLDEFLAETPGIIIASMALSDSTTGFFVKTRMRTLIVVYSEANPSN